MSTPYEALAEVPNACQPLPRLVTGGQPSAADLERFRAAGGGVVLDLRDPMEPRPFDERAAAALLGLEYVNVSVHPGTMNDATMGRILDVLRTAGDRTVFIHCGSGNRVGGALIPYFMLDHHLEEDDAVGQAMRVGLRSAELMEWGTDYARRQAAG
jgi:protein tyrosine phosphatase (PTP) superfamily phosphohydrolase (DUF442 family)